MKIVSLNIKGGLNNPQKISILKRTFPKDADLVCLQETHLFDMEKLKKQFPKMNIYHSSISSNSKGVVTMVDKNLVLEGIPMEPSMEDLLWSNSKN